jgi:PEP-utilising enzyme, mobile domain
MTANSTDPAASLGTMVLATAVLLLAELLRLDSLEGRPNLRDPFESPLLHQGFQSLERLGPLVVDIGGALSHAAIVARELGVPCVVNTVSGTRTIQTGDCLTPAATPRSPAPQHDQLSQQPV